ncbi:MAG TPA: amidohydrolase family protein [Chloroflexota bacterium]|jgi:predicted TIM-barrel fold metal-dependent hydrolase
MTTDVLISADSHVLEPADLWATRLPVAYRERAPRVFYDEARDSWMFGCAEVPPQAIAASFVAGVAPDDLPAANQAGYAAARPGGWDPKARLADMALDGVSAEVLYPSLGLFMYWIEDPGFQAACFGAFNDWLIEYRSAYPDRLLGVPMIALWDAEAAAAELRRCHAADLRGALIWELPPASHAFTNPRNDPFWAAAAELQMPVSLHALTDWGCTRRAIVDGLHGLERHRASTGQIWEIQTALFDVIFSGVLERFPTLQVVSVENEYGWLAAFLKRMDRTFDRFRRDEPISLSMRPSEYYQRQIWATFFNDPVGPVTLPFLGDDHLMWSSDYPHQNSTWPNSRAIIERDLADLPAEQRQKLVRDNVARLYGMQVPAPLPA